MNILLKQTLTASILSTMIASTAFAAPAEAPPAFVKKVADGLIARLKADSSKLQSNPALVKTIVRQNLDPYIDSQAFTRIVMGTYATNQYSSAAQRAQFEKNFRETLIENYQIIVYPRLSDDMPKPENSPLQPNISLIKAPIIELSATEIRKMLKDGKNVRPMLPPEVFTTVLPVTLWALI